MRVGLGGTDGTLAQMGWGRCPILGLGGCGKTALFFGRFSVGGVGCGILEFAGMVGM